MMEEKGSTNISGTGSVNLFKYILKYKLLAVLVIAISFGVTYFSLTFVKNVYESKAVLVPSRMDIAQTGGLLSNFSGLANLAGVNLGGNQVAPYDKMKTLLFEGNFLPDLVKKHKLESNVFDDFEEVKSNEKYEDNTNFFIKEEVLSRFRFTKDRLTKVITISYKNTDREFAKKFIDIVIQELSDKYRKVELANLDEKIDSYREEMNKINDITLKHKLSDAISSLIQNKVFSRAQEYYGFEILVKPYMADEKDFVFPNRIFISVVAAFLGLFLLIAILLLRLFFHHNTSD